MDVENSSIIRAESNAFGKENDIKNKEYEDGGKMKFIILNRKYLGYPYCYSCYEPCSIQCISVCDVDCMQVCLVHGGEAET